MVIIFYDAEKEVVYLCTEREKMKVIPVDDPNLLSQIPNDDILYVQNAHFVTKRQFGQWLEGTMKFEPQLQHALDEKTDETKPTQLNTDYSSSRWLHPAHNGAIHIPDIKTEKFPDGLELIGKYDFVPVDSFGGFDVLEESLHFRTLLAKGKIEVVDYDYVKKNYKKKKQTSLADAALDAIIIKNDTRGSAEAAADVGGIQYTDPGAIEFLVE